jgi:chemotaxis protein methyltransferase CheR
VQRRLRTYLVRSGHPNWPSYFRAVQTDLAELARLKDYLTINVSAFFRDDDKFAYLREKILPRLLYHSPRLRVWSAGCSHGHEPYSLAITLADLAGFYRHHHILATDIDRSALERGEAGGPYSSQEVEKVPPQLLKRYFRERVDGYYIIEGMRQRITFHSHNLLADPFEGAFDLIVCRNVVIYFTAEVKHRLYGQFYQALRPGGVLFVGSTEIIPKAASTGLDSVGISFYQKRA